MEISVNHARCEGHGMCAISAPDLFSLNDEGLAEYLHEGQQVPPAHESTAHVAIGTCPVAVLRIVEA